MDQQDVTQALYRALAKAIFLAVGVYLVLYFADELTVVLIFFLIAGIFSMALMPVVNRLEARKWPRALATMTVFAVLGVLLFGLGALIWSPLKEQTNVLIEQAPEYGNRLADRAQTWLDAHPEWADQLRDQNIAEKVMPSVPNVLGKLGKYSMTALTVLLGLIVLFTLMLYMLAAPRPLLRGLQMVFPVKLRDKFAAAYSRASAAVGNWVWANMVIGAIEGVAASIFLSILGIPGALVWGVVTFFAELIPQLGGYLMAIPPVIVALAVDPILAVWVILFYIVMQQLVNNLIAPPIRSKAMNIHPISEIFAVLALSVLFGILGAIIASPVVGMVKAFYDEFYTSKQGEDPDVDDRTERMLQGQQPATT